MPKRLKVAHIITRLELGGAQQNTLYCCANHDRKKYDVILICGIGGRLDEDARWIPDCRKYFLSELKHPLHPFWDFLALRRLTEILRLEQVDLVHTHSSKAGILGRWAARRAGVPHILHTIHGWGFYPGQNFLVKWIYQAVERWAATFTEKLIAVSEENKQTGLAAGIGRPEQYEVIHSGVDPKQVHLEPTAVLKAREGFKTRARPTVLILSNYKKQKSPMDVVKVAEALAPRLPNVLFLWAGDGPLLPEVEKRIAASNLQGNFDLLGWRDEIGALLAASDVLLLTSIYEGLPRVVLQAMAAAKPVVATKVSGTPEAVRDGVSGFLHPAHDTDAMAESLYQVLTQPNLGKRMGRAGKAALKGTFQIALMLKAIEKIYSTVATQRPQIGGSDPLKSV
jgi:glycosyltransferase involved in cell wall biosynthesis